MAKNLNESNLILSFFVQNKRNATQCEQRTHLWFHTLQILENIFFLLDLDLVRLLQIEYKCAFQCDFCARPLWKIKNIWRSCKVRVVFWNCLWSINNYNLVGVQAWEDCGGAVNSSLVSVFGWNQHWHMSVLFRQLFAPNAKSIKWISSDFDAISSISDLLILKR